MIKTKNLMIGDWVIRRGVPEEPMRLYNMNASRGIAYLDHDGRGVAELFENLEPIPLTPEILEKNGFVIDKEYWSGEWKCTYDEKIPHALSILGRDFDGYLRMSFIYYAEDGVLAHFKLESYNAYGDIKIESVTKYSGMTKRGVETIYVHELQHALKVWNIEKDIVI